MNIRRAAGDRALRRLNRRNAVAKSLAPDDRFAAMAAHPVLPREEQIDLCRAAHAADALAWEGWAADPTPARGRLAESSVRLVVNVAAKEARRVAIVTHGGERPDLDEMVGDGLATLMRATETFDPEFGTAFSTYLFWSLIRNYRSPRLRRRRMESLDVPSGDGETVGESIADTSQGDEIAEDEHRQAEANLLAGLMGGLAPRERRAIEARFGLAGGEPMKLKAIGEEFGVTKERARQICEYALIKIRKQAGPFAAEVA